MQRLVSILRRIDGRGYRAYKDIAGSYGGREFTLRIDHVQGDPFAEPSRVALIRPIDRTGLPSELLEGRRRIATEDFLTRQVAAALPRVVRGKRGSGRSGVILVDRPGQEILERTSCLVRDGAVEIRLKLGLPAEGRRVLGRAAAEMLTEELQRLVDLVLPADGFPIADLRRHVLVDEDQEALRAALGDLGLVAFVGEGAVLPRRSGVDSRPMVGSPVPFGPVPDPLRVSISLPNGGEVVGLGVPEGVTLIVGGGFHGKSTLLDALALGIYNHVPDDGRELVVTRPGAVSVRAEDGRRVEGVDISPFISNLPLARDTQRFCTDDASGSTSQATAILEAVELGAELLLLDEDTSASNFLVRDFRMQALVHKDQEPITPFVDRVRELHEVCGVSTILVLGGSSDYLDVADTVIQMDAYRPRDVTREAKDICERYPNARRREAVAALGRPTPRVPLPTGFDPSSRRRAERVRTRATRSIEFGEHEIELDALEQLVDDSQARAIGDLMLALSRGLADASTPLRELLDGLQSRVDVEGLAAVTARSRGDRAAVRVFEVGAAVNRLRSLKVR